MPAQPSLQEQWRAHIRRHGSGGTLETTDRQMVLPGLVDAFEPKGLELAIKGDNPFHAELRSDGTMHVRLSASLHERTAPYDLQGLVGRTLDTATGRVSLDALMLEAGVQGQDIATLMMRRSVLLYDRLGMDVITVEARMIGRYAWTRFGFDFADDNERASVYWQVHGQYQHYVRALGWRQPFPAEDDLRHPWEYAQLNFDQYYGPRTVTREDVLAAHDLMRFKLTAQAAQDMPVEMPLSMALLAYGRLNSWRGRLELDPASQSRQVLEEYLSGKLGS